MFLDRRERERDIASSALGWNQMVSGSVRDAGSQVNNKWVAAAQSRQGECLRPWWGTLVPSILPRIPALEHPPRISLKILLLYVGENGPRISDTGRIVRRLGDHRSDKACGERGGRGWRCWQGGSLRCEKYRPASSAALLRDVTGSTIKVTLRCTRMTCNNKRLSRSEYVKSWTYVLIPRLQYTVIIYLYFQIYNINLIINYFRLVLFRLIARAAEKKF